MAVAVNPAPTAVPVDQAVQPRPQLAGANVPVAGRSRRRLVLRWAGVAVYLALLVTWIVTRGLPLTRASVALWLIAGLFAFSLHDLQRCIEGVALEWFPFVGFLLLYDAAREFANRLMATNVSAPIDGDRLLFGGHVPTVWLQSHLWHGVHDVRWYDYGAWGVYMTYFFGTLVVAAALWVFAYHRFRRYVAMVSMLTLGGITTYVLFPAAPPWYASTHDQLAHTQRLTGIVWSHTLPSFSHVVEHGQGLANPVAAMPSLHAGFTLLITLFLWRSARWWWRIPLAAYPILMGFSLVYFAEHYVVDVLAGWLYATGAFLAVEWLAARRAARRRSPVVEAEPLGAVPTA